MNIHGARRARRRWRKACRLEVGRSVRTAGGAGAFCVAMHAHSLFVLKMTHGSNEVRVQVRLLDLNKLFNRVTVLARVGSAFSVTLSRAVD